jgi:hypothetical protein
VAVRDMAAVAERLRMVRRARRKFLRLWTIERAMVDPLLDRLHRAVAEHPEPGEETAATRDKE